MAYLNLEDTRRFMNSLRKKLAFALTLCVLAWPPIHLVIAKVTGISTWRLFGWGMYATPNPLSQSRLRMVILNENKQAPNLDHLHRTLIRASANPEDESLCINLFLENEKGELNKQARNGLCKDDGIAKKLDLFVELGSKTSLTAFTKEALQRAGLPHAQAIIFLSHQRVNLFKNQAYVESQAYRYADAKIHKLGTFRMDDL